ncbi:glycoside hydrolase family 76 protein [Nocardia altamirensis]|uniref:glycoside hydrolase family 76 protein n=1 Tax=Nocardia altamirensis TaxID=472158 RepID=UPI00114D0B37|nr:glycoside hydrolase family 76 protein [Nocardia altamirensis]
MIGSKRARLGIVVGVVGLTLATYLVVQSELSHSRPSCTGQPIDGGDPQAASGTRGENPQVRLWSRTVTLVMADCGASAGIENGQHGDAVWLDRARDTRDVPDGMLGAATVSVAATAQRTGFFRYSGSLLRACGKVGDRAEIRCTRWTAATDPPPDRRQRALERLLESYNHEEGLWRGDRSTWQSANALTAVLDYIRRTDDDQYLSYVEETYRHGDVARSGVPRKTRNSDDELWWALAWIAAYDRTGETRYLTAARTIVDGLEDAKASFCDGGLVWGSTGADQFQVNTITNALYLTATASLSTRTEGADRSMYLARAQSTWAWFTEKAGRALFDRSGLINDHLDKFGDNTCVLVEENIRWTYDQGAVIRGAVALYRATGRRELLTAADAIATATTRDGSPFIRDGVLDEYAAAGTCPGPDCGDAYTFKGVFVRDYRELVDTGKSTATKEFLVRQANSLTGDADRYGFRWQGPLRPDDHPNFATQAAALDALNAG